MKGLLTAVVVVAVAVSPATAQEQTLVGHGIESGGFGAPVVKFTQVNGEFGVLVGGRGGWIINHVFVLGGGGYGLVNDIWVRGFVPEPRLQFGYGGIELEGIIASNSLVHFTVVGLVGGGGVSVALLAGIWVSNFPEALGSTVNLTRAGTGKRKIRLLWLGILAVSLCSE